MPLGATLAGDSAQQELKHPNKQKYSPLEQKLDPRDNPEKSRDLI